MFKCKTVVFAMTQKHSQPRFLSPVRLNSATGLIKGRFTIQPGIID
jgi:hypothetical protein